MENVIEATILTGPFEGEAVLIPCIPMIPTDLPFQFKRLQFPIQLAFAIPISLLAILKIKWLFQNFDRVSLGKERHGKGASCHQFFFLRLKEIIPKESDISLSLKPTFTLFL